MLEIKSRIVGIKAASSSFASGSVNGEVKRHWKMEELPWVWWLRAMFGLMALLSMLGHGNVARKWFPSSLLVVWDIHRGTKTGYSNQSLLEPYHGEPWPPHPRINILFISINKDLFHLLEDGNLSHRIIPYSCQLLYSFSPFPQVLIKSRWSLGGLEGLPKKKIRLQKVLWNNLAELSRDLWQVHFRWTDSGWWKVVCHVSVLVCNREVRRQGTDLSGIIDQQLKLD